MRYREREAARGGRLGRFYGIAGKRESTWTPALVRDEPGRGGKERRPLAAAPLFESVGLSSVAVDDVHNRTVVFLGTGGGRLRKVRRQGMVEVVRAHTCPA
ncbi:hypothetical protein Z043_105051 [Scleropages formosus]|uniref:Sema domain-containing protein n=1 Tax=Scleropages formosus TaxID=113540 RepID=A0A0P7UMH6_SCLFO|nr:hypothetical protein Z043_105051 [Scleropages formosus]